MGSLAAGAALVGASTLALGAVASTISPRLRPALGIQATGITILGGSGIAVLVSGQAIGAGFQNGPSVALGLDPLSGFFVALLALTALPALVFAPAYLAETNHSRAIGALTGMFLLALTGVLAARDVITFLAFWELMTLLPAAAILVSRRSADVRASVYSYVAITHLGGAGVWIAMLTLAHFGAVGDPAALVAQGPGVETLVAVSALIGFGTKAGLIPMHAWLPRAHPVAPAHLSAVMSGAMIKVAFYGLIRVDFEWLGSAPVWLGLALLTLGALSSVGGVLWALVQHDLKRLLSYSSVENVGIIALGLGASLLFTHSGNRTWAAIAFGAALLHATNHAVFKSLLFLGAGAFERAVGALQLDRLGGLLRSMPWTGGAFLVGSMAVAGLPPLNGFASEWLTLQSLLHVVFEQPPAIAITGAVALAGLAATAALALLCFVKVVGLVLLGRPRRSQCEQAVDPARSMLAAMVALATICVVLGLVPGLLLPTLAGLAPGSSSADLQHSLGLQIPGTGSLPTIAIAIALVVGVTVLTRLRSRRDTQPAPTWVCGQQVDPTLNWTSAGFTKPLRLVLEMLLRPEREIEITHNAGRVVGISYAGHVPSLVDSLLYEPAIRIGLRSAALARRLQTGNVRTYAAYLLGLVIVALALVRVGAL